MAIVGGGISGLAAAASAREHCGVPLDIEVFERAAELGGRARTLAREGFKIERGPNAFLGKDEIVRTLVKRAGLEARPARSSSRRRFLFRAGKLRELRPNPWSLWREGVLSLGGLLRASTEPWRGVGPDGESVDAFARRRFGAQVADRLFAPMVQGVFAGDPCRLELAAAFPGLREWEKEQGSVIRGVRRRRAVDGAEDRGSLWSFADGMGALAPALARAEGLRVHTGVEVQAIVRRDSGRLCLRIDGEGLDFDAVVLAADLPSSSHLLEEVAPEAAATLTSMATPPLSVVALGYRERPSVLPCAYGALIPRGEGPDCLGVLFESELFEGRAPTGGALLRVMLGGSTSPGAADGDDGALRERAVADLDALVPGMPSPDFHAVIRWPAAIPQYELGHRRRREEVERVLRRVPDLALAGNSLQGVAFGRAAEAGWAAGRRLVQGARGGGG